jgi:hypothetical protein
MSGPPEANVAVGDERGVERPAREGDERQTDDRQVRRAETLSNSQFLWVDPSPSLDPDRWVQREGYSGPDLGEKNV